MQGFFGEFKDWASQPFSEDMDAKHWFYFLGLLIVLAVIWQLILFHLLDAIRNA